MAQYRCIPVLLVDLRLFNTLVFGPPVLEPYLDLGFRQSQRFGQLKATPPRYVLVAMELHLESKRLLAAERRSLASGTSFFAATACYYRNSHNTKQNNAN